MRVIDTTPSGAMLFEPTVYEDDRGFFFESWNSEVFATLGLNQNFVQDNHSKSSKNVLRGLHYQIQYPQGKLVRVVAGSVYDVVVDIRRSSPTFLHWAGFTLSAANRHILWVPPGFAHGFLALEDDTEFLYRCTEIYAAEYDRTILWNDADLGIKWPLSGPPNLSAKDQLGKSLANAELFA